MTAPSSGDKDSTARPGDEIKPSSYRKLPVEIKAIRWSGHNLRQVIAFTGLHPSADKWEWDEYEEVVRTKGLKIFTLEGHHMATVGDYIIKGVHGEFYPCKPDIFWKTYERATAPLPECVTCNDDPAVCATVPGLRHCEKANREPTGETPRPARPVMEEGNLSGWSVYVTSLERYTDQLEQLYGAACLQLQARGDASVALSATQPCQWPACEAAGEQCQRGCNTLSGEAPRSTSGASSDHDDAERWRAFCNLWAASTELSVAQDEMGTWSITQVEDVEGERFSPLIDVTPNDAIDKARSATGRSE